MTSNRCISDDERTHTCSEAAPASQVAPPTHVALGVVLEQLALVDGPHPQLSLDGADEGGSLEEGARERLHRLMHTHRADSTHAQGG